MVVLYANGSVHRAEEELQIGAALDFHERPELMDLKAGLLLRIMIKLVR